MMGQPPFSRLTHRSSAATSEVKCANVLPLDTGGKWSGLIVKSLFKGQVSASKVRQCQLFSGSRPSLSLEVYLNI